MDGQVKLVDIVHGSEDVFYSSLKMAYDEEFGMIEKIIQDQITNVDLKVYVELQHTSNMYMPYEYDDESDIDLAIRQININRASHGGDKLDEYREDQIRKRIEKLLKRNCNDTKACLLEVNKDFNELNPCDFDIVTEYNKELSILAGLDVAFRVLSLAAMYHKGWLGFYNRHGWDMELSYSELNYIRDSLKDNEEISEYLENKIRIPYIAEEFKRGLCQIIRRHNWNLYKTVYDIQSDFERKCIISLLLKEQQEAEEILQGLIVSIKK